MSSKIAQIHSQPLRGLLLRDSPGKSCLHPEAVPQACPSTRSPLQGHFPEAEKDPVIQIASLVTEQGKDTPTVRNVMTLKSCAPIVGAEVMAFDSEAELLKVRDLAAER
jgi:hypothetical protein